MLVSIPSLLRFFSEVGVYVDQGCKQTVEVIRAAGRDGTKRIEVAQREQLGAGNDCDAHGSILVCPGAPGGVIVDPEREAHLEALQEVLGLLQAWKLFLRLLELRGMDAPPRALMFDREAQMQHLVIENIFDGEPGNLTLVEELGEDDRVVRGVEMSQHGARRVAAPSEKRLRHQAVEEAFIEILKYFIEIVDLALSASDELPSANLAKQVKLAAHIRAIEPAAVTVRVHGRNGLAVQLADQNVGEGFLDRGRSALEDISNFDFQDPTLQTDRAIRVSVRAEANAHVRQRCAGPEVEMDAPVDFFGGFK